VRPVEHLYTIVLDYDGGTYIAQVRGRTRLAGLNQWANQIPEQDLREWGLKRETILEIIADQDSVPLNGLVGAWCLTGADENGPLLLINIIATERQRRPRVPSRK